MLYQVVFLHQAEMDLQELKYYLTHQFSRADWEKSYAKIKKSIRLITESPKMGVIPPELVDLNPQQFRQVISGMNRIIYEVRQEVIYIHLICDTRKEMQALLNRRLLRSDFLVSIVSGASDERNAGLGRS